LQLWNHGFVSAQPTRRHLMPDSDDVRDAIEAFFSIDQKRRPG
jgi:hypothetical protein